jgi:protein-S-isoprenylcysteine O-methyltransferase Ste14
LHIPANAADSLWTTVPYAYAFWAVYGLTFALEIRVYRRGHGAKKAKARDRGSIWAVTGLMFIALVLGFLFSGVMPPIARMTWHTTVWFALGLALMLVGAGIRQIAISTLGRHFTAKVMIQPKHELVQQGFYRYVRHPSYTGAFLMWLGLGFALTNIVSLVLIFGMAILAYGLRVRVEEKALKEALGSSYEAYCRRTKRFIPGLF